MSECTKNLNPAQREAVVNYDCPSLIVAGAGSGKTRVLTCRIAYMLEQGVPPAAILALTFTNKAAREMRERIAAMVGEQQARRLWMGTFHSVFSRILRAEAAVLGFPATFTIYDTADSRNLVRRIIKEMNLSDETYKPADVLSRISLAKNNLVTPEAYEANVNYIAEDRQHKKPQIVDVYREYVRKCREFGAMDFDDLLLNINILFRDHPEVTAKYQQMFRYILVDEYQDTNYAQYIIVRRLAQHHSRVCVVGDDAQSIYSFRGAKIENILRFRNDFPEATTFKLEQNYRSTRTIVSAANSVIEKNANRIKKESFSEGPVGEQIKVLRAYTDMEEASLLADELRTLVRTGGGEWSEAAILYRTNAQSRVLEEALRKRGIPYKIYGGTSFYQRKEVKDLVAYIRLVVNGRDEESLRRVINFPARGIGEVTVERIAAAAAAAGAGMLDTMRTQDGTAVGLNAGATKKMKDFVAMIDDLALARCGQTLYEAGLQIATRSGLIGMYKADNSPEAMSALENIEELLNSMHTFEEDFAGVDGEPAQPTIEDWLGNIALLTDADNEDESERNHVTLMTVHSAKGLEFKYVFIAGMEENLFPNQMGLGTQEGLEEERRLFYVALTRAKEVAVVSFAQQRFKWGQMTFSRPSRFLSEIDPKYLDTVIEPEEEAQDPAEQMRNRFDYRRQGGAQGGKPSWQGGEESGKPQWQKREGAGKPGGWQGAGGQGGGKSGWQGAQDGNPLRPSRPAGETPAPKIRVEPLERPKNLRSIGARPAEAAAAPQPAPAGSLTAGTRVRHSKFGAGTVTAVEQMTGDSKLTIAFDDGVARTLLQKFAKLERI